MDKTESLPVLYIRARNHYDVGFTIGTTFKGWIRDYMETSKDVKQFKKFYDNSEGLKIVEQYMLSGRRSCPNIISEVQGMADGAEVKFEELFLLQIASEIEFCHMDEVFVRKDDTKNEGKGCTDVLVNRPDCRIIGHNDDWTDDVSSRVYIVHVTILDEKECVIEQFVSFSYPGYLTGFCFGMNKSLVISLNSLSPKKANSTGVPLAILLRSLLACNTIEECSSTMESKPYGCAYGMDINIGDIKGTDMCSMEVYPLQEKSEVKVVYIPYEGVSDEQCYLFHENYYKQIAAEETGPCTGSRLRDKRANEMPQPKTVDDVRAILGDTKDCVEPIYRVPCPSHNAPDVKTVATAIFSIEERLLYVYRANPKLASGWIRDYLESSDDSMQFKKLYSDNEGFKIVEQYMSNGRKSHPNIMSEIQGMADGAEVKFEELFLLQISSELKFCHLEEIFKWTDGTENGQKGCTDILVNRKKCRLIGHNDDWTADVCSRVYIAHVTISDENNHVAEQFVSFCYPGYLAGFCFGINKSLVISLNSLKPKKANRNGVPLAILLRSLLTCHTIEECMSVMENKPSGCAYGMNINIAVINGTDMCSMEVYPMQGKSEVKAKFIPYEGDSDGPCYFFHQNHYKHIAAEETGPCTGSRLREKRTSEMPEPETFEDVRAILGDTNDEIEPIYRVPCASHCEPDMKTAATAIFSIDERLLYVYRSNPTLAPAPCLTLPFL